MKAEPQIEKVKGWGADLEASNRPGVPMELPPHPVGQAHWTKPAQQRADVPVFFHAGRKALTPVFGTAAPPKALSGLIRKAAYSVPDHKTRHWFLLLLADRVDVVERLFVRFPVTVPAVLLGGLVAQRLLSRAR